MADRAAAFFDTTTGALKGISQTVPDNILAGGLKRSSGDVTIDAGGANSILLRTNSVTSVTVTSGGKLTTSSTTTTPAILIGSFTADPSVLANGDIWYNSTTNKFRAREAAASVDLISAGTASGWTDAGAEVHLTTSTDEVTVGASGGTAGKFTVVGDTVGQKTVVAKQVASQTAAALTVQNSAGTDLMTLTGLTTLTYQHTTALSNVTFRTQDESSGGGTSGSLSLTTGVGGDASGGAGGSGGQILVTAGTGGNAASAGGETAGAGGLIWLNGGMGGAGDSAGTGGLDGGAGSLVLVYGGDGGTAGSGGQAGFGGGITLTTGDGGNLGGTFGTTAASSGSVTINCGYGGTGSSTSFGGSGGAITITAGEGGYVNGGSSAGSAGTVTITGGLGGQGDGSVVAAPGGSTFLLGGNGGVNGGAGGGNGGSVVLRGGTATGSSTNGFLYLGDSSTAQINMGSSNNLIAIAGYITTTSTSVRPAIRIGSFAGNPSSATNNGDIWYNSSTGKFRAFENGAAVDMIGGGASGWTDDGATVRLTTASDEVAIGTATAFAKLGVLNDATGQSVIAARCASGQSSDPFVVQNNAGTTYFAVDITGRIRCAAGPSGSPGTMYINAGTSSPSIIWDRNANLSNTIEMTHTANTTLDVTAGSTIQPGTNNTGSLGASGRKWNAAFIATVTTGDLVMEDESRDASWRFIEHHEHIQVVNQKTGKKYRLMLQEDPG